MEYIANNSETGRHVDTIELYIMCDCVNFFIYEEWGSITLALAPYPLSCGFSWCPAEGSGKDYFFLYEEGR